MYCPDCDVECEEFDDFFECPDCGEKFELDSEPDNPEPYVSYEFERW